MLGCWLLASTWTTELLSLSSSAVTSWFEVAEAAAFVESLRLEIFILLVPLTTSMNPLESQGLELDVFSLDSLTRGGSSRPGRAGKSLPFISNSGAGLKATGGPP